MLWKAKLPPSATACDNGLILESGEWLIAGKEKQHLLLHLLSALPACLSLFLMPFLGLRALSTKVFWFPFCLGWQLIVAQGSCWVSKGEGCCPCPWLRIRASAALAHGQHTLSGLASFAGCGRGRLRELKLLASHFSLSFWNRFMLAPNLCILPWKFKTFKKLLFHC